MDRKQYQCQVSEHINDTCALPKRNLYTLLVSHLKKGRSSIPYQGTCCQDRTIAMVLSYRIGKLQQEP
jgi:hypothetical protein